VPVSHNEVINAATARPNPFGVQIGGSRYYLRCTDQAIRLYYLSTEVASIVGNTKQMTVGGVPVYIAGVQTINTRNDLQGNGFGKLVALAFYAYWQAKGATRVTLVTRDTSGGFWKHLGVQEDGLTPMATAIATVTNPINVPARLAGVGAATVG